MVDRRMWRTFVGWDGRAGRLVLGAIATLAAAAGWPAPAAAAVEFKEATMIIEFNSTDEDVGIQFFIDHDSWRSVDIFGPRGSKMLSITAGGLLLAQGGGTELFMESTEPTLDELPLDEFFERFPEGEYLFLGKMTGGGKLASLVEFEHDIPAGPAIVLPAGASGDVCAQNVAIPAVIRWQPVTTTIDGEPIVIEAYEVIVENDAGDLDVFLPGNATQVTVPVEFLHAGTEYKFEILAKAENGNQTITETCFVTAP